MLGHPLFFFLFILLINHNVQSQPPATNYDEAKVPPYTLPDPLLTKKGKHITTVRKWEKIQRPYILNLFKENVYGQFPGKPAGMHFKETEIDSTALDGKAIRKQITVYFSTADNAAKMELLLYLPKTDHPVPIFAGLNFCGNHCISNDPEIKLPENWIANNYPGIVDNKASEKSRGSQLSRWPLKEIITRGYGLATVYYGDLEPDHAEGWKNGIRSSMKENLKLEPEAWSAMGAWAWGLSRIQDYLETDPAVDARKTIVHGHSRLGKATLWAAANDQRFAIVISNNSGEGGAALSRRDFGETIWNLNSSFPHWFVSQYKKYNGNPGQLPVDQHMLIALIAPRPIYIASAEEDKWADPKGEFLSAKNAEAVYNIYNKKGLGVEEMPGANQPVGETIRYHIRTGKHDITEYDWKQYLEFAGKKFD